jgi:hypothetical protein
VSFEGSDGERSVSVVYRLQFYVGRWAEGLCSLLGDS